MTSKDLLYALIDAGFSCNCCNANGYGNCMCWDKDADGKRVYECPHGCYKCALHCKHAKKEKQ